jgi:hypothetical protein
MTASAKSEQRFSLARRTLGAWPLVVVLIAAYAVSFWWSAVPTTRPEIVLDVPAGSLDLGEHGAVEQFTWKLPITNHGTKTAEITEFVKSCNCTAVSPARLTIPPGEKAELNVTLDLRPRDEGELREAAFPFAESIEARIVDAAPVKWQLRGLVLNPFRFEPKILDFRESLLLGHDFEPREVVGTCQSTIRSVVAECGASADVNATLDADRRTVRVTVVPKPSLRLGRQQFMVTVRGVREDGAELAPCGFSVLANVLHDVEIVPPRAVFGRINESTPSTAELSLVSRSGQPFEVAEIRVEPDSGAVVERLEGSDARAVFRIKQRAVAGKRFHTHRIGFSIRSGTSEPMWLEVPVAYRSAEIDPPTARVTP